MASIQQPLPHRVLSSARGLACSTFSGVAAIEAELRDPRAGKQQNVPRVKKFTGAEADLKASRERGRKHSLAESSTFRSQPADSVKEAEEAFERFQRNWTPFPQEALPAALPASAGPRASVNYEWFQEGPCAYQEVSVAPQLPLRLENDSEEKLELDMDLDAPVAGLQQGFDRALLERESMSVNSTAARRLDQIESHLQKAGSAEMYLQSFSQFTPGLHAGSMQFRGHQWEQPRVADSWRETQHSSPRAENQATHQREPELQRQQELPSEHPQAAAEEEEEANEPEERLFRCPYVDCHRNLQTLQSGSDTSDRSQTPCVHVGCTFIADTSRDWVAHVMAPHHDIQGSWDAEPDMEALWQSRTDSARGNSNNESDRQKLEMDED